MKVDSIPNESIQLGEERIEGAVFLSWNGQCNAFKETIAVAVKFDLASLFFGWLKRQRLSILCKFVIVIACASRCYERMRHQLTDLFSALLRTTFFACRIAWSIKAQPVPTVWQAAAANVTIRAFRVSPLHFHWFIRKLGSVKVRLIKRTTVFVE